MQMKIIYIFRAARVSSPRDRMNYYPGKAGLTSHVNERDKSSAFFFTLARFFLTSRDGNICGKVGISKRTRLVSP